MIMNIINRAFEMLRAVQGFFSKAKRFYYMVVLLGRRCPKCNSPLTMTDESLCRCSGCDYKFDPTTEFQKCFDCGGVPVLNVRRYYCKSCGKEVISKFVFDTLPFEKEYFKAKMAQSRKRKKEQAERVRKMLAQSRSGQLPPESVDLNDVPGLIEALNSLTADIDADLDIQTRDRFDLRRYQSHIEAYIGDYPVSLLDIPPLSEDKRKDLIWRFIAVIFLAHTGIVEIRQDDSDIMVKRHETDQQGCTVPGEVKTADRIEGLVY